MFDTIHKIRITLIDQLRDSVTARDFLDSDSDHFPAADYICGELVAAIDALENVETVLETGL